MKHPADFLGLGGSSQLGLLFRESSRARHIGKYPQFRRFPLQFRPKNPSMPLSSEFTCLQHRFDEIVKPRPNGLRTRFVLGHLRSNAVRLLLSMIIFLIATAANATLISRAGGAAYYDDVLDITWLTDANYALAAGYGAEGGDGAMTYQFDVTRYTAEGFIAHLNTTLHLGVFGWRMPKAVHPDPTCSNGATNAHGYGCTGSEMGNLFYTTLGNTSGFSPSNTGPFINIQEALYWTSTPYAANNNYLYDLHWNNGGQGANSGPGFGASYVWAVLDGDIATVPEPGTGLLLGIALAAMGLIRKTRI